jgi:tetratricopeptide (TPR) repeat protein
MKPERSAALLIQAQTAFREVTADPRRGRAAADAVALTAHRAGAHEARVVALRAAGWAARELYDHDTAQQRLREAVRLARRVGLDERLCEVLITRSAMYLELGHPGLARRDLKEAGAVASSGVAGEVAFAQGLLEDKVGNFSAAVSAYERALDKLGEDRQDVRAKALNNLGLTVARLGRYAQAERLLAEAVALAQTFSPALMGIALESRADVAIASGRYVEALRRYDRAEQVLTRVGVQLVDLYLGKAKALLTLRLLDEAADAAARAVHEVDGLVGGSLMLAEALLPQAQIALARNRVDEAASIAARAERLFMRQRRSGWRATAALLKLSAQVQREPTAATVAQLDRIERTMRRIGNAPGVVEVALLQGEVSASLGRVRKAAAAFGRAADAAAHGPALLRLQGRRAAARRAELHGDTRRLGQLCRLGLDELAGYRATVASTELRARAAAHGMTLAEIGLRAAVRAGRPEQIWMWMERARSVVFIRSSTQPDEQLRPMLAELRSLEHRLDDLSPDVAAERASLLRRVAGLERRIRSESWTTNDGHDAWMAPSVRTLRTLRTQLDERVLLQYGVLDGDVCGVAVTRNRLVFAQLGSLDDIISANHQLAFALRRLSQPRSRTATGAAFDSAKHELRRLAATLLAPLSTGFSNADEIVVSPPGELIGIPWGALAPLADRPVRVVPSAVAWWRSSLRTATTDKVVLVAGPGLAGAEDEIAAIAHRYDGAVRFAPDAATSDDVKQAAAGAQLVHIAAHGRLRSDSPTFSSVQLADGPLTVHDLEGLPEPAHHWVLAACDLGNPGALAGPALEGVLAALLSGGAGAAVAAVVSVPDLPTRDLMVALHDRRATGMSLADALRRAGDSIDTTEPTGFVAATAFSCYGGG